MPEAKIIIKSKPNQNKEIINQNRQKVNQKQSIELEICLQKKIFVY